MRSSVQMLFQVDKSTAVGIQPIKAMRKAKPAPSKGLKSAGAGGTSANAVWQVALQKATMVLTNNTPAIALIKASKPR